MKKIYNMLGFCHKFGHKLVIHVESVQYFKICVVSTYEESFWPNLWIEPQHVIHFLHLLFKPRLLSYRTLKSDNFEKMTYTANMFFYFQFPNMKKMSDPKNYFCIFFYIIFSNQKTLEWSCLTKSLNPRPAYLLVRLFLSLILNHRC